MNRRNRSQEKNKRSLSQKAGKQKSRKNSSLPTKQRTHLRNESEFSSKRFLGEYSDKGTSGQYLRPNIHPIYQPMSEKTWKRNTAGITAHAQARREHKRRGVEDAITALLGEQHPINFNTVARTAQVS